MNSQSSLSWWNIKIWLNRIGLICFVISSILLFKAIRIDNIQPQINLPGGGIVTSSTSFGKAITDGKVIESGISPSHTEITTGYYYGGISLLLAGGLLQLVSTFGDKKTKI